MLEFQARRIGDFHMREKIKRTKKKIEVDMAAVNQLKFYQKEKKCNLIVRLDGQCSSCEHIRTCRHYSVEREYINNCKKASKTECRRSQISNKQLIKEETLDSLCEYEEFKNENESEEIQESLVANNVAVR